MVDNLKKLYATMLLIETKGESTKIMGECLRFTEQLIKESTEIASKVEESN